MGNIGINIRDTDIEMTHFNQFTRNFYLRGITRNNRIDYFSPSIHYIQSNNVQSLKRIEFSCIKILPAEIECLTRILQKIERTEFDTCSCDGGTFKTILSACENMKYLEVYLRPIDDWLLHRYSKLKQFKMEYCAYRLDEIKHSTEFFELNRN